MVALCQFENFIETDIISNILDGCLPHSVILNLITLQFSLCLEDLVPVAVGRYAKSLTSSIYKTESARGAEQTPNGNLLEKIFSLYMEQVNLWSDICSLPEIKCPELSESSLYG